jgi:hypothetical protein
METQLTTSEEKSLISKNQDLINQARQLSGTGQRSSIPFIPTITVNNKETEKEAVVDGMPTMVKVPPKKGFLLTYKNENNEKVKDFLTEELEAVILRVRYQISSKAMVNPRFYSREFDYFSQNINLYDENNQVIATGTYKELGKLYETGELNTLGKPKKSFDLQPILYLDIKGEIYRFRVGNASRSAFFDYMSSFSDNDVVTAYITKFNLTWQDSGQIKFWQLEFERGEEIQLENEILLQKELYKYFNVEELIKNQNTQTEPLEIIDIDDDMPKTRELTKDETDLIIDQIPF